MKNARSNNNNKRHMVNILDKDYQEIYNYCSPRNLIIGKWIASVCLDYIKTITVSGSYGK